jgi:hypothetical protein
VLVIVRPFPAARQRLIGIFVNRPRRMRRGELFRRRGNSNEYDCRLLFRRTICRLSSQGVGSTLLADAALRVLKGDTKAFALIVEAKDESAVAFYQFQGFRPFASRPMSLFLPLGTAKKRTADENSP